MNDTTMSLSCSTRELRIERNAANEQRFELKLLLTRLNITDKQSAGMLLDIIGAHDSARSNITDQAIMDTLISTEMRVAPTKERNDEVPLKRDTAKEKIAVLDAYKAFDATPVRDSAKV
jgi:hypothetical protein